MASIRNGIKQNSKIKIANESVYLGKQVDGMFRVYLDEYIPGAGVKEVALFLPSLCISFCFSLRA